MKTITFREGNYSVTFNANEIVATSRTTDRFNIFLRSCDEPFTLRNTDNLDEWYTAIWEDTTDEPTRNS